jgi:hypothetical protein
VGNDMTTRKEKKFVETRQNEQNEAHSPSIIMWFLLVFVILDEVYGGFLFISTARQLGITTIPTNSFLNIEILGIIIITIVILFYRRKYYIYVEGKIKNNKK